MFKQSHLITLLLISLCLCACGTKLSESDAIDMIEQIYDARKKGNYYKEFSFYDKDNFNIVPFKDVEASLRTVMASAGKLKSFTHTDTKISRRNQINQGLVQYMILTYSTTYRNAELIESYYFLADVETPKLVYMTLSF